MTSTLLSEATVDLRAIGHNTALVRHSAGVDVMAVVKADAFGHGIVPVARAATAHGAGWLGVTNAAEALTLREAGIVTPVLSWLHGPDEDFDPLLRAGVDVSIASADRLDAVAASSRRTGQRAAVHLKVDTGMSRNGAGIHDWPDLVRSAKKLEREQSIDVRAVWSHLACADRPGHPSVAAQIACFEQALGTARSAGLDPPIAHLGNSAAALAVPAARYSLVRAGIALYGVEPVIGRAYGLRPALTLRSQVIMVREVPAGTGISYDHAYVTSKPTTLALVPLGYADGVPRQGSGTGRAWVGGVRVPIAGHVTMDQLVLDVGEHGVRVGDEVVVFGPGDRGEPTAAEWAVWAGTNPHELLTGIGARVARRHVSGGHR